jgi:peptidoglycan/xylan/chitin deacetylase (PgdA/CDA1 family)
MMKYTLLVFLTFLTGCSQARQPSPIPPHVIPVSGSVTITFDDGYQSAYENGISILDAAHIKTTQFIITGEVGHRGYMTQPELALLAQHGHEIAAHTQTHPHLSTLSELEQRQEIIGSFNELTSWGYAPQVFAYPYGDYDQDTLTILSASKFVAARSIRGGFNVPTTPPLVLLTQLAVSTTTTADVHNWIAQARAKRTWLILTFHRVDDTGNSISVPHELVQETADYITKTGLDVVTVSGGLAKYGIR